MKLHIENINITLSNNQPPAGLIAALTIAGATASIKADIPAIGEKWPGLDAVYAGVASSLAGDQFIHLIVWLDDPKQRMNYEAAVKYAESVNPEMGSHLPTRYQAITLFERLQDRFNMDYYHWTLTKTKRGDAAFIQTFSGGDQSDYGLSSECRVRAVSEIPL